MNPRLPAPSPVERELPWPKTYSGKKLVDDYYSENDARKGVGFSLGARVAAVEAEARTAERQRILEVLQSMLPATDVSAIKDRLESSR